MSEGLVRTCRYVPCGKELPRYSGRGRPREYCDDPRWPSGKTCREMDAERRAAEVAAGLDVPLATFRTVSGPVVETAQNLADRVAELLDTVRAVDAGALSRIEETERAMVEATAQARGALAERDAADRERQAALAERDRAHAAAADVEDRAAGTSGVASGVGRAGSGTADIASRVPARPASTSQP